MTDTLLSTTVAGVNASIIESLFTYPLEYTKTHQQLFRGASKDFELPEFSRAYFRGCSPLVIGNALRATVRFSTYNWATKFMSDGQGTTSAPQIAAAGMLTGLCESFVVVPFESIKVTMIERGSDQFKAPNTSIGKTASNVINGLNSGIQGFNAVKAASSGGSEVKPDTKTENSAVKSGKTSQDAKSNAKNSFKTAKTTFVNSNSPSVRPPVRPANTHNNYLLYPNSPLYGLSANCRAMYNERGFRAFIQGFWPTLTRQLANSVVKFSCYNFLKQAFHPNDTEPVPAWMSLTLGGLTGAIQVLATQPIDVIKTRMQSVNGLPIYKNSLFCSYLIFTQEGPRKLWAGLLPRFIKVSFSGGIVFTVYEATNSVMNKAMKERPFDWK